MTATSTSPTQAESSSMADLEKAMLRELQQRSDASSAQARYTALAVACKQALAERWASTQMRNAKSAHRAVHYLSMEFLMGRALGNALAALSHGAPELKATVCEHFPLQQALDAEPDAALGNGGLGRLAACFLDAFAELELPSFGYGLRYEHGMFAQAIQDGKQTEQPDDWLRYGAPWELPRPELSFAVGFGGKVSAESGVRRWVPAEVVDAHAVDFIVPGHYTRHVSTLRLWQAKAPHPLSLQSFNKGEYIAASQHKISAESLNWVLYPDDSTATGRELRLRQEFLLVSASLQDMMHRHLHLHHRSIETFGLHNAVHLNDTHPALAPAELMRLLLDEHGLAWDAAWKITRQAVSYTNHTLMPEALETWPVSMMEKLLPRHLDIIYQINQQFLDEVRQLFPGDEARVARLSLIDENGERKVRMASLAIVASSKVNGVSALHSQLMVDTIFADFAALWPERFFNVTNGVTPRRWLMQANPALSSLLDETIGTAWRRDLMQLVELRHHASDDRVLKQLLEIKKQNKQKLAERIRKEQGIVVSADSLFDVQVKRIHEYKRQLLNVLQVIARYQAICANPDADWTPRVVIFAGKAASAYHAAKQIIQLIHDVARVVNCDPRVGDKLKMVFMPNYGVSVAEVVMPAADLSEQISTAGTEASGTGNMKFALNGALTIGTWDGANIEMAEAMGTEHMFVFGLRTEAVAEMKRLGYDPRLYVEENLALRKVIAAIEDGTFSGGDTQRYRSLTQQLLQRDPYMLMADFADYLRAQTEVDVLYSKPELWARKMLYNIAGMGPFSVDRTINEYSQQVWAKAPVIAAER